MRELLIATTRQGKLDEIRAMLMGQPFKILSLKDVDIYDDVSEVGSTCESNALIKAFTYGKRSGKLTMAEDSGLEVAALGGKPGVHTADYVAGTEDGGCQKFLTALKDVPDEKRGALTRSVIVIYDPADDSVYISEGVAQGRIVHEARGKNGFGQDPIFLYDECGKTGGEMSLEEKNAVSHRAKALAKAREILLKEFV